MSFLAVFLFLLGFAASFVAGRYLEKGAALVQAGAIGLCGVAALFFGLPHVVAENFMWGLVALAIYGLIGALIFRSAQGMRERSE